MAGSRRIAGIVVAAGLLVAGCGRDGEGSEPDGAAPGAAAPTSAAPTSAAPTSAAPTGAAAKAVAKELRFTAKTVDGQAFAGESLAGKDAVLWFWAAWCPKCNREAPSLASTAQAVGGKVSFVGVSGHNKQGEARTFVAKHRLGGFPHVLDSDGAVWTRFGVTYQPAYAFVDDKGKVEVVTEQLSAADLERRVQRLIAS